MGRPRSIFPACGASRLGETSIPVLSSSMTVIERLYGVLGDFCKPSRAVASGSTVPGYHGRMNNMQLLGSG